MGEVYKAIDTRLGRSVAIKTLQGKHGDRFEREARAIAALNHPHICQLYDIGSDYLVMEFLAGQTVREQLDHGPFTPDMAIRCGRQIAEALEKAVDEFGVRLILTTGDNIYRNGDEDDDWYFTYYQPYRYVINRVPTYPTIGNHDAGETESRDDREQLIDNFYVTERIAGEEAAGRASIDPGLFYRFRYSYDVEFICIDTSKEQEVFKNRFFDHPKHQEFLKSALPTATAGQSPTWRIPFCHHPPFCAGPDHHNTKEMSDLVKRFEQAGVRLVLSGHQHQFQHSRANNIDYLVTGGAGKVSTGTPNKFAEAHTKSWAAFYHFLLVTVDGKRMTVRAIGQLSNDGKLVDIARKAPDKTAVTEEIKINLP